MERFPRLRKLHCADVIVWPSLANAAFDHGVTVRRLLLDHQFVEPVGAKSAVKLVCGAAPYRHLKHMRKIGLSSTKRDDPHPNPLDKGGSGANPDRASPDDRELDCNIEQPTRTN